MNYKKIHNIEEDKTSELVKRIRFRPVSVDSDAAYDRLWKRIVNAETPIGVSSVWKYVSIAASVLLLCVSSVVLKNNTGKRPLSYMEVTSMAGSKTQVLLPDSTIVWLNGDSWIRYPESFDDEGRRVELIGEAFFQVSKDKERPFSVNLDGMRIEVLGTEFNVFAKKQVDIIETTLVEGSVALFSAGNETLVPDRILNPNDQAIYTKRDDKIEVHQVRSSLSTSWVTGNFFFDKVTFGDLLQVLEHSFHVKFHLKNERLERTYLTAQFTHQESLDDILSILQISLQYTYIIKDKTVYIK